MANAVCEDAIMQRIEQADPAVLEEILDAVICRYAILFPDWDVIPLTQKRTQEPTEQLERALGLLKSAAETE